MTNQELLQKIQEFTDEITPELKKRNAGLSISLVIEDDDTLETLGTVRLIGTRAMQLTAILAAKEDFAEQNPKWEGVIERGTVWRC